MFASRHCRKSAACIMRCRQDDITVKADNLLNLCCQSSDLRSWNLKCIKQFFWDTDTFQDFTVPCLRFCIDQCSSCSIGVFIHPNARQYIVEILRNHQERIGIFNLIWMFSLQST